MSLLSREKAEDELVCECTIRLLSKLPHAQHTIVQESADCAQGMGGTPKMPTMMDKWISTTAGKHYSKL